MRARTKKFSARFELVHGKAFGTIDLAHAQAPPLTAGIIEDMTRLAGRVYRIASGCLPFWLNVPKNFYRPFDAYRRAPATDRLALSPRPTCPIIMTNGKSLQEDRFA